MKVFWIVNIVFPYPNKQMGDKNTPFGGWLIGLYNEMIKNKSVKLAIATVYNGKEYKSFDDGNTIYYLIPRNKQKMDGLQLLMNLSLT